MPAATQALKHCGRSTKEGRLNEKQAMPVKRPYRYHIRIQVLATSYKQRAKTLVLPTHVKRKDLQKKSTKCRAKPSPSQWKHLYKVHYSQQDRRHNCNRATTSESSAFILGSQSRNHAETSQGIIPRFSCPLSGLRKSPSPGRPIVKQIKQEKP